MRIEDHYWDVYAFNNIAGNFDNVDEASLAAQVKVVVEEVKELEKAFVEKDAVELLDGVCDAFVTVGGLMQKMQEAGFDVNKALSRVCENNLEKYCRTVTSEDFVEYNNRGWKVSYNRDYDRYVLKDENGKIRKPDNFKSVVLSDLVPKGFFKGGQ
jgi:hypothetical protein